MGLVLEFVKAMPKLNGKRIATLVLVPTLIPLLSVLVFVLWRGGVLRRWGLSPRQTVETVVRGADLRDRSVAGIDLREQSDMVVTFWFNLGTRWPPADKLPPGVVPGQMLTNAMNPGLGVRELHRQGITGQGVSVAIIDYPIAGRHEEYAERIAEIHPVEGAAGSSMHGPAVASLLVGRQCGTAPGARLYFLAVPDPGRDAREPAEALDWVVAKNRTLPGPEQIRAVSVSASHSGPGSPFRNGRVWDEAVVRAERAGILVVDGTITHGFLAPCNLDPKSPEDVSRCAAIPTQRGPKLFAGRLLVPVAPRTVAEEMPGRGRGYHYCGWKDSTFGMFGTSWSMPYCTGVLALGWQVNPQVPAARMKELLFESAYAGPDGARVIDPTAFIQAVKKELTLGSVPQQ
jgi:serine protease AprX